MKNKKAKIAVKAVSFLLIVAIILFSFTGIFSAKWYDKNSETAMAKHIYQLDKDSIEVLLLGSSQVTWSIDSVEFYEKHGILTYSIGGSHNNLLMNYYWLMDTFTRQRNIKTVMLDVSYVFNDDEEESFDYMKNIQGMRFSKYKLGVIKDYYNKIVTPETEEKSYPEVLLNYLFTLYQYHSRWNELDEVDFDDTNYDIHNVMGFTPTSYVWDDMIPYEEFVIDNDKKDNSDLFNQVQFDYLKMIVEECKSRGVDIVLIKTPKRSWSKTGSDFIQKYADENGLDFLECTSDAALQAIGVDYDRDFKDPDHLNVRGAQKLADYLCEYLLSKNTYTDYREKNGIPKKELKTYYRKRDECYLNSAIRPKEYFKELDRRYYTVILQSSGDIAEYWTDELQQKIEKLGFTINISEQKGKNYIAAIKEGKVVLEVSDTGKLEDEIKVVPSKTIKLTSKFSETETKPSGEKALGYSKKGLRITVFDKNTGMLVSRATVYEKNGKLKLSIDGAY